MPYGACYNTSIETLNGGHPQWQLELVSELN